jgi:diadenylate cyclase
LSDHGRALPQSALLQPRGYRLLSRIPRLGDGVIEHVVEHFGTLSRLRSASVNQLTEVDGVGDVRARAIREGLSRVMESVSLDLRGR